MSFFILSKMQIFVKYAMLMSHNEISILLWVFNFLKNLLFNISDILTLCILFRGIQIRYCHSAQQHVKVCKA